MAKTVNAYIADQGEAVITISTGNVSTIAAFTTAEDITLDGALRAFRRTNNPERPVATTRVTGDTEPITTVGDTVEHETWEMILVDDYSEGAAGEWGTDLLSAYEIFREFFTAREDPGGLAGTPAGGATGDIEYTLTDPKILAVGLPETDADKTDVEEVTILLTASGHTTAAHT